MVDDGMKRRGDSSVQDSSRCFQFQDVLKIQAFKIQAFKISKNVTHMHRIYFQDSKIEDSRFQIPDSKVLFLAHKG